MTIKQVIKMGNKKLLMPSRPIEKFNDGELKELISDMKNVMKENGGVGIAAPQIGCNVRVIMFGFDYNERYPNEKPVPFSVIVNPIIQKLSEVMVNGWEGCLSIPGLRGLVPRYKKIQYQGYDAEGKIISQIAEGFHSRVVQHEFDHIEGILFPHRIKEMKYFGYEEELKDVAF